MGTETLAARKGGQKIRTEEWFNILKDILDGDVVPRGNDGAPRSGFDSAGSTSIPFSNAFFNLAIHLGAATMRDVSGKLVFNKGGDVDINMRDRMVNQNSLKTLFGLPTDAQDFGTFTGTTIPDNSTYLEAINKIIEYGVRSDRLSNIYLSYSNTPTAYGLIPSSDFSIYTKTGYVIFATSHDGYGNIYITDASGVPLMPANGWLGGVSPRDEESQSQVWFWDFGAEGTYNLKLYESQNFTTLSLPSTIINPRAFAWGI